MAWQLDLVDLLTDQVPSVEAVDQMWAFGSVTDPATLDEWSDADIGLVLSRPLHLAELLSPAGSVWAVEQPAPTTGRLVFVDGRRLDLVSATAADCANRGGRLLWSRPTAAPATGATGGQAYAIEVERSEVAPEVNQFRFMAALALVKFGRGDRMIGTHLRLGLLQLCLVQLMRQRDRKAGTTSHRHGGALDQRVAELEAALGESARGPEAVWSAVVIFDRWTAELEPHYVPDWSALEALGGRPGPTLGSSAGEYARSVPTDTAEGELIR